MSSDSNPRKKKTFLENSEIRKLENLRNLRVPIILVAYLPNTSLDASHVKISSYLEFAQIYAFSFLSSSELALL